ncbi:MAG: hypothetical protein GX879_03400, partial [Bacteroidales bacterium]|nr:hypothetical protein [Bacteroidales bacterium]
TYTDFDTYVSATFYVIKTSRFNQKALTGILNSKLIEFWLKHKGKMQGTNYQLDKAPLLELPLIVPPINTQNQISLLVEEIIKNKTENIEFDTSIIEAKIDQMVYELYELSEEEIEVVENTVK